MRDLYVEETECKTILNRSKMGFADYTLNAYQGCAFGCSYCYVPVMRQRRGQVDDRKWGGWVQVKVNAPDVLRRQMLRVQPEERIAIGTATDSWQPLEKRYRIARRILEELALYPNPVHIVTRSPLLHRDIDILQRMSHVRVGISLPTFEERARRIFEPVAPTVAGRVHLLRALVEAGINVSLFWAPILYGVADNAQTVREYLSKAAEIGIKRVICSPLNYTESIAGPHMQLLRTYKEGAEGPLPPRLSRAELCSEIDRWAERLGLDCRLGK
jgi:DNA repair photolyase